MQDAQLGPTGAPQRFDAALLPNDANYVPLSPISFLKRAAIVYSDSTAVIHGDRRYTYRQFHERSSRLARALMSAGVNAGDRVAVLAPNIPEYLEAHFGVPGAGAVLVSINIRLDPASIAFILRHSQAKVLITDKEYAPVVRAALAQVAPKPLVIDIDDSLASQGELLGDMSYETLLGMGKEGGALSLPETEWQAIALNYTSGTTADPKGVVLHHRGAYLNACAGALAFRFDQRSTYLWTLPMFHCNGWSHVWAITLAGGCHVCLRRVQADAIYTALHEHGVTHMSVAPVVMSMLVHSPEQTAPFDGRRISIITGGAAPPTAVIAAMETKGFRITHAYGMTESYGPSTICQWLPEVDESSLEQRAAFMSRQGIGHPLLEDFAVLDADSGQPVPTDGKTLGELVVRGNTVMKGYLDNPAATDAAFLGSWLRTGDLAVWHTDGYVEIKDRSKDIIISGGENISSLEIEQILYQHRDVVEAAVVAQSDEHWGETPHAFVRLRDDAKVTEAELIGWCKSRLAHFKAPRHVTIGELPKTATGKIQKFLLRERVRSGT